jgi:hypothetical protein
MTTPLSGTIKFSDIKNVFNQSGLNLNIKLSDYYTDSSSNYTTGILGIPTHTSLIKFSNFYNKSKIILSNLFTNNVTINIPSNINCDILVVGGGGAGGWRFGGGGGGGGVVYQKNVNFNSGTYKIVIGKGGVTSGNNGENTKITDINNNTLVINNINYEGIGGGYGGGIGGTSNAPGNNGGSGGGGQGYGYPNSYPSGKSTQGLTYFNGTTNIIGGGDGITGRYYGSGNGGGGFNINISGTYVLYAYGGNGGYPSPIKRIEYGSGGAGGDSNNNGSSGNSGVIIIKINNGGIINIL